MTNGPECCVSRPPTSVIAAVTLRPDDRHTMTAESSVEAID
jgi:hypothetical protein